MTLDKKISPKSNFILRQSSLVVLLLLLIANIGFSQQVGSSPQEQELYLDSLYQEHKYEQAFTASELLLEMSQSRSEYAHWLYAFQMKVRLLNKFGRPLDALSLAESVLEDLPYEPGSEEEFDNLVKAYNYKSWIEMSLGDLLSARISLEKAYAAYKSNLKGREKSLGSGGYIYRELGNAYAKLKEYKSAQRIFEEGIAEAIRHDAPILAKYNDYGTLFLSRKMYAQAAEVFERGSKHPGQSAFEKILLQLNQAEALIWNRQLKKAEALNNAAFFAIKKKVWVSNEAKSLGRCLHGYYENKSLIEEERGQTKKAIASIKKARSEAIALESLKLREYANIEVRIASLNLSIRKKKEALAGCSNALNTLLHTEQFKAGDYPIADQLVADAVLIDILELQADCLDSLGNPERALEAYSLIPLIEAQLRASHDYEASTLEVLQNSRRRFDKAISLASGMYQNGKSPRFAEKAFEFSEMARGLLLLETLEQAQAGFDLPEGWRKQENSLERKIAWCIEQKTEMEGGDKGKLKAIDSLLFALKRDQSLFVELLKDSFPNYPDKYRAPVAIGVEELGAICQPGRAMLSYYLTREMVFVFHYEPGKGLGLRQEFLPPDFREGIKRMVDYLGSFNQYVDERKWFQNQAFKLYRLLLEPELKASSASRLLIMPDDVLTFIPFELLFTRAEYGLWTGELPYLIRDYPIGYAYSATLLEAQHKITGEKKPRRSVFAGFAPDYKDLSDEMAREGVYQLEGTRKEVKKARSMLGGKVFLGKKASEQAFREKARRYRILLLSMHGFANEENPAGSRLLFGDPKKEKAGAEDDVLYAFELGSVNLNADLVVLSACQTGAGKLHRGEGVYSLSRAFAAAGVPTTVMSLWRLSDVAAPALVTSFFKQLKNGQSKDEALRQAKLAYLADENNEGAMHPSIWAGVVANGDMSPMDLPANYSWIPFFIGIIGLFLLVLLGRRRVIKRK